MKAMVDIAQALKNHLSDDHKRGCQGREYKCDCRYDSETERLLEEAYKRIQELERKVELLRNYDYR